MFRQLYEGFDEPLPAPATQMNRYFNYTQPGSFIGSDQATPDKIGAAERALMDFASRESTQRNLQKATNFAVQGQVGTPFMKGLANHFLGFQMPSKALLDMQAKCKTKTIDDIIVSYDPNAVYNCGFVYDKENDRFIKNDGVGRGYLGSKDNKPVVAPGFDPLPSGEFFWDASIPKKTAHLEKCKTIGNCGHLANSPYKDICAWCGTTSSAIPVKNGSPVYSDLSCNTDRLFTKDRACPADTLPTPAIDPATGQVCTNLSLSRDCIIQAAKNAQCTDKGSLILGLQEGTSTTNYDDVLKNNKAYSYYNTITNPDRLIDSMFAKGNITETALQANLNTLYNNAQSKDTLTNYAARDLCLEKGYVEQFDFCAEEITANKKAPFTLKCLQQQFRLAGGQGAGTMYPNDSNKAIYDSKGDWNGVREFIGQMKSDAEMSTNIAVQERALRDFLGVKRESLYNPVMKLYKNYEVYSFADSGSALDAIFIGRRIQNAADGLPDFNANTLTAAQASQLNANSKTSFVIITDLRPGSRKDVNFAFNTKDGVVITVNKDMTNYASDLIVSAPDQYSNNRNPANPVYMLNDRCTALNPRGNNRIKVYWNSKAAGALKAFSMYYVDDCTTENRSNNDNTRTATLIPKDWISLTQEPDAPVLSFEVTQNGFTEKRLPEFFPVQATSMTTVVAKSNYDSTNVNPGMINRPYITMIGPSSSVQINKIIRSNAFQAISLSFKINQSVGNGTILSYGQMKLSYNSNRLGLSVGGTNAISVPIQVSTWYIALIRIGGSNNRQRNKLVLNVIPYATARGSDPITLDQDNSIEKNGDNILSYEGNNILTLGKSGSDDNSAVMDIGSLRLYDQVVSGPVIQKDARNSFSRNWYNAVM